MSTRMFLRLSGGEKLKEKGEKQPLLEKTDVLVSHAEENVSDEVFFEGRRGDIDDACNPANTGQGDRQAREGLVKL